MLNIGEMLKQQSIFEFRNKLNSLNFHCITVQLIQDVYPKI